jgi:glycosyltransferase involved in cell wall biosynthesis
VIAATNPPADPPLRILHLASSERWTGVAEPVTSLAVEQRRMGHEVWLACATGRSFERKALQHGLPVVREIHLDRRLNPFYLISDLRFLARFCRENRVDVVHCHLLHDHWVASLALRGVFPTARRREQRPFLVRTLHGSGPPRGDWFHRRLLLKYTNRFVCVSAHAARLTERALRLPEGSVAHVPGAVDLERFRPGLDGSALRAELAIPPDAPVAGIVARMRSGRGIRWLLEAVPLVLAKVPQAHFMMVGRGELKHWFRQEIKAPEYRGQVRYAGYRGRDLPEAYAAMDVSLFLGLGSEGTCRAVLEAMACARPVAGVALGAVPEIIDDGRTGRLVRPGDAAHLAARLIEMLADRDACARLGRAARLRAEELFRPEARERAFDAVYRELTGARFSYPAGGGGGGGCGSGSGCP